MKRKTFLKEFLGAIGAEEIHWKSESETSIAGTVFYEIGNPEETQDFVWHAQESDVPSDKVLLLAELLHENKLLSLDKITVSRQELHKLFCAKIGYIMSEEEFLSVLNALKSIEVPMVDNGKETDIFFIHE